MFSNKTSRKCSKYATIRGLRVYSLIWFISSSSSSSSNSKTRTQEFKLHCGFQRWNSVFDKCYFRVLQNGNKRWVVCLCVSAWFSLFIPGIFHKRVCVHVVFFHSLKRSVYALNDAIRYPSSQRWFFNKRPMTFEQNCFASMHFTSLRFHLVFEVVASTWLENEWKKPSGNVLFRNISNTFCMELNFFFFKSIVRYKFYSRFIDWSAFQHWPNAQFPYRICLTIQILLQKCSGNKETWNGTPDRSGRKSEWVRDRERKGKSCVIHCKDCMNCSVNWSTLAWTFNWKCMKTIAFEWISAISSDFTRKCISVCSECESTFNSVRSCMCMHTFIIKCNVLHTFMKSDNLVTITIVCIVLLILSQNCFWWLLCC